MSPRLVVAVALAAGLAAACGAGSTSPTNTTAPTQTKVLVLGGTLSFGSVSVGSQKAATMTIENSGNTAVTISSITLPCSLGSQLIANFTSGAVAPGTTQPVALTFAPAVHSVCSGVITVAGDQTSGTNTIAMSATGTLAGVPLFTVNGTGNATFVVPSFESQAQLTATFSGAACHTFSMTLAGQASPFIFLNLGGCGEGAPSPFTGTAQWGGQGGTISVTNSDGVSWTFTEIRNAGDGNP